MVKFFAQLESLTNTLQTVQLDLFQTRKYVVKIIEICSNLNASKLFL